MRSNEVDRTTVLVYRLIKIICLMRPYLDVPILLGVTEPKQNFRCANLATVRSKSVLCSQVLLNFVLLESVRFTNFVKRHREELKRD